MMKGILSPQGSPKSTFPFEIEPCQGVKVILFIVWNCLYFGAKIRELSYKDFSVIREARAYARGTGIGGYKDMIYMNTYKVGVGSFRHKYNPVDFSIISTVSGPAYASGIGGDDERVWGCNYADNIYEYSPTDLSIIRSRTDVNVVSSKEYLYGAGGGKYVFWLCSYETGKAYEVAISDFSIIRMSAWTVVNSPQGIGGSHQTLLMCFKHDSTIRELLPEDFSFIRSVSYSSDSQGIGGKEVRYK